MDMKKYTSSLILPEDLRNGPRQERIKNVYLNDKHDCPVLVFESGDELFAWSSIGRVLARAYGYESDDWKGHLVELWLGNYVDKNGETKETVILKTISPREGDNNGGPQRVIPMAKDLDDEIPFK